jgi:hypothetical protein
MKLLICFICLATFSSYAQSVEVVGSIQSKKGSLITITMTHSPVKKGDKLGLYKYKEGKIGNIPFTSWIDIALVEVVSNANDQVLVSVLKENSVILIDGKKKDQFTPGATVKLQN